MADEEVPERPLVAEIGDVRYILVNLLLLGLIYAPSLV